MGIRQELLKNCTEDQRKRGYISTDMETELNTYIDSISDNVYLEIAYSDLDQVNSVDCVFNDTLRTVTYSGSGTDELITDEISLSDVDIKGIQIKGTDMNEVIQITKDGTNYYTVDAYNICEYISSSDTFKIKILVNGSNTIKGINIIYQTND